MTAHGFPTQVAATLATVALAGCTAALPTASTDGGSAAPAARALAAPAAAEAPPCSRSSGGRPIVYRWSLPEGSTAGWHAPLGCAGNGPVHVALAFNSAHVVLACVGAPTGCRVMGGVPQRVTFNIPADFPAGPLAAGVYFNPNVSQPPGPAAGTLTLSYAPY